MVIWSGCAADRTCLTRCVIHYRPLYGRHGDQLRPRHSSSSVIGDEQLRSPSSGETQEPEQEMIETSRVG